VSFCGHIRRFRSLHLINIPQNESKTTTKENVTCNARDKSCSRASGGLILGIIALFIWLAVT
jgi:hypothetical protein